jgi:hypothetical protein
MSRAADCGESAICCRKDESNCSLGHAYAPGQGATGGDKPIHHFSCTLVRFYVAKYNLPAAAAWARSHLGEVRPGAGFRLASHHEFSLA